MFDLKEEMRKAREFSKTPEGMELARQHALKTAPKRRAKYRHSDETKVKMSLNSGRRRAVFVGEVRYESISEAAEAEGISYANFQMRLNRGREGYRYA
jgi:DNA-directed RNA polymerase specialized sigma24 family protein